MEGPRDRRPVVAGGHDDHGNAGMFSPQLQEAVEPADTGHGQVEQHQIDIAMIIEKRGQGREILRLHDDDMTVDILVAAFQCSCQRIAKHGMVVDDDDGGGDVFLHSRQGSARRVGAPVAAQRPTSRRGFCQRPEAGASPAVIAAPDTGACHSPCNLPICAKSRPARVPAV